METLTGLDPDFGWRGHRAAVIGPNDGIAGFGSLTGDTVASVQFIS